PTALHTLFPYTTLFRSRRQLGLDAQAIGTGEASGAAFLADEVDHLAAVERRVLDELQLHRLVRHIDTRDAKGPRGEAHLVALERSEEHTSELQSREKIG